ncbi:AzlD domain-containing protein [Colwellia psychrerythraea]|uniref:Branched-chain amino acid transport n=1 Tax=Colwellia psychrerythraea TaxID=28229 RepID=A0A099K7Q5_COLPS|nr:AzlD domain-containing protein [Colwellia psychrerythraea]KGJ86406.1 branched-chain amino acid transport [Colwellia psychrerythraea]
MNDFWIALAGMAGITFSCRYLFFSNTVSFKLGPKVSRLLSYTAPSVMTAMWVPIVFLGHQDSGGDFITSPFLIAGVATLIFSLLIKNTLAVVIFGMSIFALLQVIF